jgi:D-alanyl-D-alanine carboxypeptidase
LRCWRRSSLGIGGGSGPEIETANAPAAIQAVFNEARYKGAAWGLRVINQSSGAVLIDLNPDFKFLIGSVRKVFSVGELLNQIGSGFCYNTPVFRQGIINGAGVLNGDLILERLFNGR